VLTALGFLAMAFGLGGTWVAGKRRTGWAIGCIACCLWIAYSLPVHQWAAISNAVLNLGLGIRNYRLGRTRTTD
jgi:hypothetical protein